VAEVREGLVRTGVVRPEDFGVGRATIADLLSHRSGLADTLFGPGQWESLMTDPLHAWTIEEELATVGPERTPAGQSWEFVGTIAEDHVRRRYINRYVGHLFTQGAQNPISYVNLE